MKAAFLATLLVFSNLVLAAPPQWTWDAGKQTHNGAVTVKSVNGAAFYAAAQNPTGTAVKLSQIATTQPPTVIVQSGGWTTSSFTRIVAPGPGVLKPPTGAIAMRVAVVGAGGAGYSGTGSGGGGGCSASKTVPVSEIEYLIGAGGNASNPQGGSSWARFTGYMLVATGGNSPNPGIGSGGDHNFQGSAGANTSAAGGGGAAGPNGNGEQFAGTGWGPGGGGRGGAFWYVSPNNYSAGGGGGSGAPGAVAIYDARDGIGKQIYFNGAVPIQSAFGKTPQYASSRAGDGGEIGGGGGYLSYSSAGNGGVGGLMVEWFYQ